MAAQAAGDLSDKLVGYTLRAGISAGINRAVYGQAAGSFGSAFVQSFVQSAAADAAQWVGGNTEPQTARNIAAHALIGCAAAAVTGRDCGAGAVGAAAAAALNPLLDSITSNDDKLLRDAQMAALSTAAGGLVAAVLGQDIATAVSAAQNETLNNYLTRAQKTRMFKELEACGDLGCKAQVYARYGVTSGQQDIAFASGTLIGAAGRAAEMGVETVQGIGKIVEDIPGTLEALKAFVADLDAEQIERLGAEKVAEYKQRIGLFERNYQTGGWQGAQDAGIEFGALVVDGAVLATGIGGAARLTVKLGIGIVEKAGAAAQYNALESLRAARGVADNSVRETVLANIAEIRAGNASSNFGTFVRNEGKLQEALDIWPPNRGRVGPVETVELQPGQVLDRYGLPSGRYVSPRGTPFAERALPSSYESTKPYFQYEVVQPLPEVTKSRALPWFGQKGMGVQYELPESIEWYIDNGYLRQVR